MKEVTERLQEPEDQLSVMFLVMSEATSQSLTHQHDCPDMS